MKIKIGINGFGRIGRYFLRLCLNPSVNKNIEVTKVNSPGSLESSAHLLEYDSVHGRLNQKVSCEENFICVNGHRINYSRQKDVEKIDWKDVDIVLESTGVFKEQSDLKKHLKQGVKKVIVAAPAKGADLTVVYGVNHKDYKPQTHHIISNASCTTNGVAPLALILNREFGIEQGFLTTIHAYTSDQKLLDSAHKDLRRTRAAGLSMIPTTTGATSAVEKILPQLKGKLQGLSIRVPTPNVSLIEFVVSTQKNLSVEKVHQALKESSQSSLKGILDFQEKPLVSCDFLGSPYSCVVDLPLTKVNSNHLQLFAWYDNETGFCHRLVDMIHFLKDKGFS